MTRIIGGTGKGRRLRSPRGEATRPTGARVRQTLFDILAPRLPGCRFLDAFAGSGSVGLEALSRGAARVVLVEKSREQLPVLALTGERLRHLIKQFELFGIEPRIFCGHAIASRATIARRLRARNQAPCAEVRSAATSLW